MTAPDLSSYPERMAESHEVVPGTTGGGMAETGRAGALARTVPEPVAETRVADRTGGWKPPSTEPELPSREDVALALLDKVAEDLWVEKLKIADRGRPAILFTYEGHVCVIAVEVLRRA